jgi:hypothetical protein
MNQTEVRAPEAARLVAALSFEMPLLLAFQPELRPSHEEGEE